MKNVLFLLLILTSFSAAAQIPKSGHDGYKKKYVGGFEHAVQVKNNRNFFLIWSEGPTINGNPDPDDLMPVIKSLIYGKNFSYNKKYYYTSYKDKDGYWYRILIYSEAVAMCVNSKYNDAEFERCKKMLDKEAEIIMRTHEFSYKDF